MISLKTKILCIITLIVVSIVSVSALLNLGNQKRIITSIAERNAVLLAEAIKGSISDTMLSGHSYEISNIFAHISSQKLIKTLRILDESGKVLNSANPNEIGTTAFSTALLAYRRGAHSTGTLVDNQLFVSITPIANSPACTHCHDPSQKVLGLLEIESSLDYIHAIVSENRRQTLVATGVIILLLVASISFFMWIYLDKPIGSLVSAMQRMENGDFSGTDVITTSKEMNLLSTHYNRMADRLQQLISTFLSNERELAHAQAELTHHREIRSMNDRLVRQLREIEDLNASLEERIVEIEEANYKIADMAGDLEDKNSTLERAVARLSSLHKMGLAISSTMDLATLSHMVVKSTTETLQARIGFIALYAPDNGTVTVTTLLGCESLLAGDTLPVSDLEISSWAIANRRPVLIPDIADFPQFKAASPLGFEKKTGICVPLMAKESVIGTINVVNRRDDSLFTNEDLELLTTIAGQASIAITNARLYEEQQKSSLSIIQSLVSAIEACDGYTRGHSERVTRYSLLLARKLDLPPERLSIIEQAAILHDIGKIGIDMGLLNKKGILTGEETAKLRLHPVIGMKILEPIRFLQDVSICISQHHERYDGTGYPNNLGADSLLLESRILSIADAYDAMTSDRPYRNALPLTDAVKELLDNAGAQFDPHLVPQFVELLIETGHVGIPSADSPRSGGITTLFRQ